MKTQFTYIAFCCFVVISCQQAPAPSPAKLKRISFTSQVDQKERDFFLYLPEGYETANTQEFPVLLFLHGNGERGNGKDELDYVLIHGPLYEAWVQKRDLPFIIISPQLHMFGRDTMGLGYIDNRDTSWIPKRQKKGVPARKAAFSSNDTMIGALMSDTFPNNMITPPMGWEQVERDLMNILDSVLENYRTDAKRVYLSGISYGGFGTWWMASKHSERFAAIAPIVGWGHPSLMPSIAEHQIPVWVFAGGRDGVVEARYFYKGMNELEKLGHKKYSLYNTCR